MGPGGRHRVYVASRTVHAPMWLDLAGGHPELEITSSWIDSGPIDEADSEAVAALWVRCVDEVAGSEAVITYHEPHDTWKGAFVEIGVALGAGLHIHLIGDPPGSWVGHPLVVRHPNLTRAVEAVTSVRPLTVAEAAVALGRSTATVRRWCAQGRLPAERHGERAWAIPRWAVARERSQASRPATPPPPVSGGTRVDEMLEPADVEHLTRRLEPAPRRARPRRPTLR